VADVDGQLVPGDQILVVNGVDVRSSQQQDTAAMLKVTHAYICYTASSLRRRHNEYQRKL